jgi:uncharacterized protein (DUF849 family)
MKTILTCAVTGAVTTKEQSPYLPITPEEIADSALEAADSGAAIVHIHVRNIETGGPSMKIDYYQDVCERIKKSNKNILINLTTGPGATFFPTPGNLAQGSAKSLLLNAFDRTEHIKICKPELCSLDFNTMHQANNGIRINHKLIISAMLDNINRIGTKPELEIFDSGDLVLAKELIEQEKIIGTPFFQFAMGIKYGWVANLNTLIFAKQELPKNCIWGAFGIGKTEMPILSQTMLLGGHVRVGLEDNIYTKKNVLAKTNSELVKIAAQIIDLLGGQLATFAEAREILEIPSKINLENK